MVAAIGVALWLVGINAALFFGTRQMRLSQSGRDDLMRQAGGLAAVVTCSGLAVVVGLWRGHRVAQVVVAIFGALAWVGAVLQLVLFDHPNPGPPAAAFWLSLPGILAVVFPASRRWFRKSVEVAPPVST